MEYFSTGPKLKKGRTGSMPKNVSTVLNGKGDDTSKIPGKKKSSSFSAFADELKKIAAGHYNPAGVANQSTGESGVPPATVTDHEALEAADVLDRKTRGHRPLVGPGKMALVGGALAPGTAAANRAVKGFVDTKGGLRKRLVGAGKGLAGASLGTVAGQAVGGAISGAGFAKARQMLTDEAAENRVERFLKERRGR